MQPAGSSRKLFVRVVGICVLLGVAFTAAIALTPTVGAPESRAANPIVNGAGASFPFPLYSKWFYEYEDVAPGTRIDYSAIGSGGGIRQIIARTVDFAASDAPMTDDELAAADADIVHIPTVVGGVAVSYNLELGDTLKLTPDVLAGIFLGRITEWDDPRLSDINPGLTLPSSPIVVARRSDSSGTTYMFTDYLAAVSPEWAEEIGAVKQPEWPSPNNVGGKGNPGVAGVIQQIPGAIGYIELSYAVANGLPSALLLNEAGNYVEPTLETVTAAAAGALDRMPADYRVSLVNSRGARAYPIAGFTYLLVHREQLNYQKGKDLAGFIRWALHEGQAYAPELLYAPLPPELVDRLDRTLMEMTHAGEPLLSPLAKEGSS